MREGQKDGAGTLSNLELRMIWSPIIPPGVLSKISHVLRMEGNLVPEIAIRYFVIIALYTVIAFRFSFRM